jgi:hypothetical protein
MPLVSDVVRSALGTDLSPDDITLLARRPQDVLRKLREAYSDAPPDYSLPHKGSDSRPWVVYGRESTQSTWRAPTWRARAAVQTLIYSDEVAIEDPVSWYLHHPYAEPQDAARTLEVLSAVAELTPLIDEGIVRCMPQRSHEANSRPASVHKAFARLLFGPQPVGPDFELAVEFLELLDGRQSTQGGVDIGRHPGNYSIFDALRETFSQLAEDAGLFPLTESVVVVPDIAQVTTADLIRIRQTGAINDWQDQLAAGRAAYEEALADGATGNAADEAFRGEMAAAAVAVTSELESLSWRSLTIRGARRAGVGAAGALAVFYWGWEELAKALVGAVGVEVAHELDDARKLRKSLAELVSLRRHFDTFVL